MSYALGEFIENVPAQQMSVPLVGRIFHHLHERAGAVMAQHWKLSDEFVQVAACHHDYASNRGYPRSAAIVGLAHRMDLLLCMENESDYAALVHDERMEFLGIPESRRHDIDHELTAQLTGLPVARTQLRRLRLCPRGAIRAQIRPATACRPLYG